MAHKVVSIPTINDNPADFAQLFGIWAQVNDYFEDVLFDFADCRFLRPNAVAFLGGLARLLWRRHQSGRRTTRGHRHRQRQHGDDDASRVRLRFHEK